MFLHIFSQIKLNDHVLYLLLKHNIILDTCSYTDTIVNTKQKIFFAQITIFEPKTKVIELVNYKSFIASLSPLLGLLFGVKDIFANELLVTQI